MREIYSVAGGWKSKQSHSSYDQSRIFYKIFAQQILQRGSPSSLAWSENNVIAFSLSREVQKQAPSKQSIFFVDANEPNQYASIDTTHSHPILHLAWNGAFILASDGRELITIWKSSEFTNEYYPYRSFPGQEVIFIDWLQCDTKLLRSYSPEFVQTKETIEQSFMSPKASEYCNMIPFDTLGFIFVSSSGKVVVRCLIPYLEGKWHELSYSLSRNDKNMVITHADLIRNMKGEMFLAVSGPSLGNCVQIHSIILKLKSSTEGYGLQAPLLFQIRANLPTIQIAPYKSNIVSHIKLDPFSETTCFYFITSTGTGGAASILLWRYEYLPENHEKWQSKFVSLTSVKKNADEMETEDTNETLDDDVNPNFVTFLKIKNFGKLYVGYLTGSIEIRDCKTLEVINKSNLKLVSQNEKKRKKLSTFEEEIMYQDPYSVPMAATFSPNNTCICCIDQLYNLHVMDIGTNLFVGYNADPKKKEFLLVQIVEMLNFSLLKSNYWWDILLTSCYILPDVNDFLLQVIIKINKKYLALLESQKKFYFVRFEALKSAIYRCMSNQEVNYLNSQTRLFLTFFKNLCTTLFKTVPNSITELEEKREHAQYPDLLRYSYITCEWAYNFSVFFSKNCYQALVVGAEAFVEDIMKSIPESILNHLMQDKNGIHILFGLLPNTTFHRIPFIPFFFELETLDNYRSCVYLSYSIREVFRHTKPTGKFGSEKTLKMMKDYFNNISEFYFSLKNYLDETPKWEGNTGKEKLTLAAKKVFSLASTCFQKDQFLADISSMFTNLNLFVNETYFFQSLPKQLTEGVTSSDQPVVKNVQFDIISYNRMTNEENHKKCTRCHRISGVSEKPPSSAPYFSMLLRWKSHCPICYGAWKHVIVKND